MKNKSLEEKFNYFFGKEILPLYMHPYSGELKSAFEEGYKLAQLEMQEKLDQVQADKNSNDEDYLKCAAKRNTLERQLDEAVEVIRFYADVNTWTSDNTHDPERVVIKEMDFHCIQEEGIIGGKRAREYFEKYKGRE